MTTDTNTRYIPIPDWEQYHPWPSEAGLRSLIINRKHNGFDKVVVKIGKRVLINEIEFLKWMEYRNKFNFSFRAIKKIKDKE